MPPPAGKRLPRSFGPARANDADASRQPRPATRSAERSAAALRPSSAASTSAPGVEQHAARSRDARARAASISAVWPKLVSRASTATPCSSSAARDLGVADARRLQQRRLAGAIGSGCVGARVEQPARQRRVAGVDRELQRRDAVAARGVDVGAGVDEPLGGRAVADRARPNAAPACRRGPARSRRAPARAARSTAARIAALRGFRERRRGHVGRRRRERDVLRGCARRARHEHERRAEGLPRRSPRGAHAVAVRSRARPCCRRTRRPARRACRARATSRFANGVSVGGADVPPALQPTGAAAREQHRQRVVIVLIRVRHAAAVHDQRVIEQAAVAVGSVRELAQEIRDRRPRVVLVELREPIDVRGDILSDATRCGILR